VTDESRPGEPRRKPLTLGDIIRQQRELAELPMRQLATMVGISNPYLSQIERGLRAPSEQVLEAIAQSLRTSADALYAQAAAVADEQPPPSAVVTAIGADPDLTAKQRQALVETYLSFIEATRARRRRRGRPTTGARSAAAAGPDDAVPDDAVPDDAVPDDEDEFEEG
jgi:transcriptional regulator with XRE-family HTH domain